VISNNEYQPEFLTNNRVSNTKILTTIQKELKECDEFWFSVAFITTSGIATLFNILDSTKILQFFLEFKYYSGRRSSRPMTF